MKSSSKAKRLRKQRGRPFVAGVVREPNGRISRAITPPEAADKLTLEVRARMMGVSVEAARDPRLVSYIGRLAILGVEDGAGGISGEQYNAALTFLEIRNNWLRAIGSPAAFFEERIALSEGENQEEAVRRDKARYEGALKAVQEAQCKAYDDNLYAALQYLVIEDRQLPHMLGTLRLTLNALSRHFYLK